MDMLVIGNKPYKNIHLSNIFDKFEGICRCNMSLPNLNNGTKFGTLGLCNHLHESLVTKKVSDATFLNSYSAEYEKKEIIKFLDGFKRAKFDRIYFADPKEKAYNHILKAWNSPYRFTRQPRTGYNIVFDNILSGNHKVFVTNFTIKDEPRTTYYVKKSRGYESNCHSKNDEINIIKWLHNNNKIDASLCTIVDCEKPTLECSTLKPTKFIIDKIMDEFNYVILEGVDDNDEYLDLFVEYNIKKEGGKVSLYKKNYMNSIDYEKLRKTKESVPYDTVYSSTTVGQTSAILGTVEADASGNFGKFDEEIFRGEKIFNILKNKDFNTVLDVGAGKLEVVEELVKLNKTVDICELEDSYYLSTTTFNRDQIRNVHIGDINTIIISETYDAIWAAHILEHQPNPNIFLKKLHSLLNEGGYLSIVVPPRKPFIVGGHVNMWNGGLLLYHLVLAGFDCSQAQLMQYDYNIGVVVKKKTITPPPKINYDLGDLDILKKYFPIEICEGFNGDIMKINID